MCNKRNKVRIRWSSIKCNCKPENLQFGVLSIRLSQTCWLPLNQIPSVAQMKSGDWPSKSQHRLVQCNKSTSTSKYILHHWNTAQKIIANVPFRNRLLSRISQLDIQIIRYCVYTINGSKGIITGNLARHRTIVVRPGTQSKSILI